MLQVFTLARFKMLIIIQYQEELAEKKLHAERERKKLQLRSEIEEKKLHVFLKK